MSNRNLVLTLVVIVLVIGVFSLAYFYRSGNKNGEVNVATTVGIPSTGEETGGENTPPEIPASPGAPAVETSPDVVPSSSTAVVNGRINPNGSPTMYWYEYGPTPALESRTSSQSVGSGFVPIATPAYLSGLKANTAYYFRLSARNRYATVNGATYIFTTNDERAVKISLPKVETMPAADIARTSAVLKGRVNPSGSQTVYWFEYGKDADLGETTRLQSVGNGNAYITASMSVSDLTPLTKYYFRLNAQNLYGTVNGVVRTFSTKGPVPSE